MLNHDTLRDMRSRRRTKGLTTRIAASQALTAINQPIQMPCCEEKAEQGKGRV